jgi:hydroxymethylglutaryl-CoA reductase
MTPRFYELPLSERQKWLAAQAGLTPEETSSLAGLNGLTPEQADHMVENAAGVYALPMGIAQHFVVNGREVLVPMVIEEPSVVAGASYMARLAKAGGGFTAKSDPAVMIGQIQVLDVPDLMAARKALEDQREELLKKAACCDTMLEKLGGGPRGLEIRLLNETAVGPMLVVHLLVDVLDAMGANAVNTAVESIAADVARLTGGRVLLRILSNLADQRLARASCTIPLEQLAFGEFSAETVRDGIIEAWAFAEADPYRAATHNKGIMNGIDAVVIASGNDWRAVEAGAHAYAARSGRYTSLSTWSKDPQGNLTGSLEIPMAVGIIGGATRVHPGAKAALKLMGVSSAAQLAEVIVSVGLAQNLAALRALATEGIQKGHMSLHARQIAAAAGASGETIEKIAAQMVNEKNIRLDRAIEILKEWKS